MKDTSIMVHPAALTFRQMADDFEMVNKVRAYRSSPSHATLQIRGTKPLATDRSRMTKPRKLFASVDLNVEQLDLLIATLQEARDDLDPDVEDAGSG